MKLKTLILGAIGLVVTAAAVLYSIGHYSRSQTDANKGLYDSCSAGNAAAAAYWLAKGADANAPDWGHSGIPGQTPLMMCAHLGHSEIVELLLLLGADPNAVDSRGQPVIHRVTYGYVAEVLVRHGADVNKKNKEGLTALQDRLKNNYILENDLRLVLEGKGMAAQEREAGSKLIEELRAKDKAAGQAK
jgi:ankyrin repeat protein